MERVAHPLKRINVFFPLQPNRHPLSNESYRASLQARPPLPEVAPALHCLFQISHIGSRTLPCVTYRRQGPQTKSLMILSLLKIFLYPTEEDFKQLFPQLGIPSPWSFQLPLHEGIWNLPRVSLRQLPPPFRGTKSRLCTEQLRVTREETGGRVEEKDIRRGGMAEDVGENGKFVSSLDREHQPCCWE